MLCFIFVANLSKIALSIFPWKHIFESGLMQNQPFQLSNHVTGILFFTVSSFLNHSKQIFVCYTKRQLCGKFEQNRTRNKEVAKTGNDIIVTSFLQILQTQQFFVCEYCLLIPIDVTSFKLIDGQMKGLQGLMVPSTPSG